MRTYIEIILLEYIFSLILTREFCLLCAHGWAGQTQHLFSWRRISQSEMRNSAAEKNWNWKARAGKNSFPPTPFLFARPSDWISKFKIRIFVKKCSNFVQKTPPSFTFSEIERCCLGAKRLGMVFFRNFEGIFEIQNQSAVGNAEVRRAKLWQNEILQTNLFSFAFSERLSVFLPQGTLSCFAIHLVFDCTKTNFKTIWTT
ncbi:MAG: hypothetical protein WCL23_03975 [Candidatus Moraniibacteriota bacterium]